MKRNLQKSLQIWREHPLRKPLILRGARQVGKSWLIQMFGKEFEHYVEINFEKDKKVHQLFDAHIDIPMLLNKLSLYTNKKIVAGKTLLFLDEIQECENALKTLRYFKEDFPELHVIAAGSLIDFALEKLGMPVGRVQFLYVYPLSFGEFLTAQDRDDLRAYILTQQVDPVIHQQLLELLKNYLWLGGMPAVVSAWLMYRDPQLCQQLQSEILTAYSQDFYKYARTKQIDFVTKIFETTPTLLGKKFKYNQVDEGIRAYQLKEALLLLEKAGVVHRCFHASGQTIPLGAEKNEKHFKVFFFDVGLAQRMLGLDLSQWVTQPIQVQHLGGIAEQLVAQELIACSDPSVDAQLYYWHREAKSSNAEVDFLMVKNNEIIPVEVKSGTKGRMKSLKLFLEMHPKSTYGLKVSEGLFSQQHEIKEIPLYALEAWLHAS